MTAIDTILLDFYRLLSSWARRKMLADTAALICDQIPMRRIALEDSYIDFEDEFGENAESEDDFDVDTKIKSILRQSIPWEHEVAQYLGDPLNFFHVLDYALGDDGWSQALGGWEGDDEWLVDVLSQEMDRVSEISPGFRPSLESAVVHDFFDHWRRNFFSRLLTIAKEMH